MTATSNRIHDIPGVHRHWVTVNSYTSSTDNGYQDLLMVAPWTIKIKSVKAYFHGPTAVIGSTGGNYFTFTAFQGTSGFGTSALSGTIAFGSPLTVFSGTQSIAEGTNVYVQYGTAGGTAALSAPRATFEIQYEGA